MCSPPSQQRPPRVERLSHAPSMSTKLGHLSHHCSNAHTQTHTHSFSRGSKYTILHPGFSIICPHPAFPCFSTVPQFHRPAPGYVMGLSMLQAHPLNAFVPVISALFLGFQTQLGCSSRKPLLTTGCTVTLPKPMWYFTAIAPMLAFIQDFCGLVFIVMF